MNPAKRMRTESARSEASRQCPARSEASRQSHAVEQRICLPGVTLVCSGRVTMPMAELPEGFPMAVIWQHSVSPFLGFQEIIVATRACKRFYGFWRYGPAAQRLERHRAMIEFVLQRQVLYKGSLPVCYLHIFVRAWQELHGPPEDTVLAVSLSRTQQGRPHKGALRVTPNVLAPVSSSGQWVLLLKDPSGDGAAFYPFDFKEPTGAS